MKKGMIITTIILSLIVVFVIYKIGVKDSMANNLTESNNDIVMLHGKTDGFNSLKELEDGSSIIVIGTKGEEVKTKIFISEISGEINGGYTISDFKIEQVYKNDENNSKIKEGNNIPVLESSFYDEKTGETYSVNGYKNMVNGEKYLLFLTPEIEGSFATRGVTFGKLPLNADKVELYEHESTESLGNDEHINVLNEILEEAKQKYKK